VQRVFHVPQTGTGRRVAAPARAAPVLLLHGSVPGSIRTTLPAEWSRNQCGSLYAGEVDFFKSVNRFLEAIQRRFEACRTHAILQLMEHSSGVCPPQIEDAHPERDWQFVAILGRCAGSPILASSFLLVI
jgi:hypothetical protein